MDEEKLKRICKNMEDLSKHILDRFQKDIDDLNRCRLEIEQNLPKHNNDFKKVCQEDICKKHSRQLSSNGYCLDCNDYPNGKPIQKS